MIQVLLGAVLGPALLRYGNVLGTALQPNSRTAAFGLAVVFFLSTSSWIVLARRVSELPYSTESLSGRLRFYADVAAVGLYAILLVTLEPIIPAYGESRIAAHFWVYVGVFGMYSIASFARQRQAASQSAHLIRTAPRPWRAVVATVSLLAVAIAYTAGAGRWDALSLERCNQVALGAVLLIVMVFRSLPRPKATADAAL